MIAPPWRTVFSESYSAETVAKARAVGDVRMLNACHEQALVDAVGECHALIVRTSSQVTRRVIDAAPNLRVIGRGGVGLDNIDLDAAHERDIPVVYTPNAATDAVADLTFSLMLGLIWKLSGNDAAVRRGDFVEARNRAKPRELCGLTLGIVGMGRIGKAVGRRAVNGFLMDVLYTDIDDSVGDLGFIGRKVSPEKLYKASDVVSLHVPLTQQTKGMIDRDAVGLFKPGALLINTARGAVVDTEAVFQALKDGKLAGAGFDVLDCEPPPSNHPLLSAPNTLFTPHIGARSELAQKNMNAVVEDVILVLKGLKPRYPWTNPI